MQYSAQRKRMDIFRFILVYFTQHAKSPTIREIQEELDLSSTSVVRNQLDRLVEDGFLQRDDTESRSLHVAGLKHDIKSAARRRLAQFDEGKFKVIA